MKRPDDATDAEAVGGVVASSQHEAERLLRFACPTRAADGKWYRVTLALSNVPVVELYTILSQLNFIACGLEDAANTGLAVEADILRRTAKQLQGLRSVLKHRDGQS